MIKTQTFQDLVVWQKAHKLTLEIYKITKQFPKEEIYGLVSQMRRSAVSVSANVAEGYKKRGKLDKARFLNISEGSLNEVKYYLILSRDLNYLSSEYDNVNELVDEISKLLNAYIKAIYIDLKQ